MAKMYLFSYYDNSQSRKLIFTFKSHSILLSDIAFQKATGIDPVKAPYIGCTVTRL